MYRNSGRLLQVLLYFCLLSQAQNTRKQGQNAFKYKVAIVGNPAKSYTRFDDQQLSALKRLGFNTLQINIACSTRYQTIGNDTSTLSSIRVLTRV